MRSNGSGSSSAMKGIGAGVDLTLRFLSRAACLIASSAASSASCALIRSSRSSSR